MNRRNFILGTGVAAGGLMLSHTASALAAAVQSSWKLRLSTSTIQYSKVPIEDACRRIAELGFEAIDIWSAHAGCPHLDDVQKRLGPDGLKELLARHRLKLYAFSVYAGGYPRYAELLGKAGGGVAVRGSAGPCDPKDLQSKMKAFLEGLKPELELCDKHNSYLAIENHGNALLNTLDSFKAFADLNRHPRLGIALAPYHLQAMKTSVEEAISVSGKQLFFFYAWQNSEGVKQLPGLGDTDFTPWLRALQKINYAWYVNPFMHNEPEPPVMSEALSKSKQYLEQAMGKVK